MEGVINYVFIIERRCKQVPSTGSAVGYFLNFVVPVCSELFREAAFDIDGTKHDLRSGNFEFRVVMPESLSDANQTSAELYCVGSGLTPTHIQTKYRKIPFWVQSTVENGKVIFWDYPTALKSSDEAVKFVTQTAYLNSAPIRKAMEKRELANFEKVVRLMLESTSEGAPFRGNVKVVHPLQP